ncbi:MAG: NUDIX domain-containing protein [Bacteroidales bacterium]|jgi:mutator protein MutT|nr:NUDIX domain-containing protein [Bacteroidales bacterium]
MNINETHPKNAFHFCPYCGSENFIWDNEKAHQCKKCSKKLYTNEIGAVIAVIFNPKGELLLTRRAFEPAKGKLDLPGGFIDLGESAEEAVCREVKEELNLNISELQFFGTFPNQYPYGGLTYFTIDIVFVCKVTDFDQICPKDDVENYLFCLPQSIDIEEVGLLSVKTLISRLKSENFHL